MKDSGIKFHYLQRDDSNYKDFGFEVFTNKGQLKVADIEVRFKSKLIDSEFFYPDDFGVKKFCSNPFEPTCEWYEFEMFEEITLTNLDTKSLRDIESFLNLD